MPDHVQVTAQIPRDLKKRAFIVLAEHEQKFTPWLRQQLQKLLEHPCDSTQKDNHAERA